MEIEWLIKDYQSTILKIFHDLVKSDKKYKFQVVKEDKVKNTIIKLYRIGYMLSDNSDIEIEFQINIDGVITHKTISNYTYRYFYEYLNIKNKGYPIRYVDLLKDDIEDFIRDKAYSIFLDLVDY